MSHRHLQSIKVTVQASMYLWMQTKLYGMKSSQNISVKIKNKSLQWLLFQTVDKAVSELPSWHRFLHNSYHFLYTNKCCRVLMPHTAHIFAAFWPVSSDSCTQKSARPSFPSVLSHTSVYIENHDSP